MTMQAADWVDAALRGVRVVNIGQLDAPTIRALDREVKAGRLVKSREHWAYDCAPGRWNVWKVS